MLWRPARKRVREAAHRAILGTVVFGSGCGGKSLSEPASRSATASPVSARARSGSATAKSPSAASASTGAATIENATRPYGPSLSTWRIRTRWHTQNGPASDCRRRPSSSSRRAAARRASAILGALRFAQGVTGWPTPFRDTSPTTIRAPTGRRASRPSQRIPPTATGSTTSAATSGSVQRLVSSGLLLGAYRAGVTRQG
jgi:hypothetical protein